VEFRILGPLEAVEAGRPVPLGGAKQRALLAVLLLEANRPVSSDRLVDALWGESPPGTPHHAVQVYVSQLRKALGGEAIVTRPPGYVVPVEPDALDLHRFERLVERGRGALAGGDADAASRTLREALDLWRGPPLADFAFEAWAQGAIARLEELRLVAVEDRIEADLALGRHAELVGELEAIVRAHPLRERPRGQLMLALYRAGRQAEALAAYQDARRALVEELGIDPGPALQRLERAILTQDESLDVQRAEAARSPAPAAAPAPERSLLVLSTTAAALDPLLALVAPLARSLVPHELVLARVVGPYDDLADASADLNQRRGSLLERGVPARSAAFTSADPGGDLVRLAAQQDVDLLVLATGTGEPDAAVRVVLDEAPCDVALVARAAGAGPGIVVVLFGGGEHDWAALELGAWLAAAHERPLRLLGTAADEGRRDASRLLATASLAVQQLARVPAEPYLAAGVDEAAEAAAGALALVVGLPERWRAEWLGSTRGALAAGHDGATLVVRRGVRPGGLTPPEGLTRYTWSLGGSGS
jgi:DNA-binding SARP family transcriptional activator